jgi:hypothetical protein
MGLGVSLILIAVGAILTWAVEAHVSGVNVTAVGVILMIVGLIGGLFSLAFWSSWWGPGSFGRYAAAGPTRVRRRRVVAPAAVVEEPAGEVEEVIEERY